MAFASFMVGAVVSRCGGRLFVAIRGGIRVSRGLSGLSCCGSRTVGGAPGLAGGEPPRAAASSSRAASFRNGILPSKQNRLGRCPRTVRTVPRRFVGPAQNSAQPLTPARLSRGVR